MEDYVSNKGNFYSFDKTESIQSNFEIVDIHNFLNISKSDPSLSL